MPKKKQTNSTTKAGFVVTFLLGAGMVAAVAAYVKTAHADKVPASEHIGSGVEITRSSAEAVVEQKHPTQTVAGPDEPVVYSPVWDKESLHFRKRRVRVPEDEDTKVYVVNEFLKDSRVADPSAKLLSVDIRHGVATLSFNSAINQTHGTDDEKTLLDGLRTSMGQFPEIDRIELLANGKPIDTFGNVDLSDGLTVIRPGGAESATRSEKSTP